MIVGDLTLRSPATAVADHFRSLNDVSFFGSVALGPVRGLLHQPNDHRNVGAGGGSKFGKRSMPVKSLSADV